MKQARRFKKLTALLLTLALMIGLAPMWGGVSYAVDNFNELSLGGDVYADYDGTTITISGHGQIERDKWKDMAKKLDSDSFTVIDGGMASRAWETSPSALIFNSDSKTSQIKLPINSSSIFQDFQGQLDFGTNGIDTSDVTKMFEMFISAKIDTAIELDISNVADMRYAFCNSDITDIKLMANGNSITSHQGMLPNGCLESFEFDGLPDLKIKDAFARPYKIEKYNGADWQVIVPSQLHTAEYTVPDNGHYKMTVVDDHKDINSCSFSLDPLTSYAYTGEEIKPNVTVKDDSEELKEGKDYTVSYENNTAIGSAATIKVTGKGYYEGEKTLGFSIVDVDLAAGFKLSADSDTTSEVIAKFADDTEQHLLISGYGQIDRDKWQLMARKCDNSNFTDSYGWFGEETFAISFQSDDKTNAIKLPVDSSMLFESFDGKVEFGANGVDTSAVTNMREIFAFAESVEQAIAFDISKVTDLSGAFFRTGIKQIKLMAGSNSVSSIENMIDQNKLDLFEFNGLANLKIDDAFSGDYKIEKHDGTDWQIIEALHNSSERYTVPDNGRYRMTVLKVKPVLTVSDYSKAYDGKAVTVDDIEKTAKDGTVDVSGTWQFVTPTTPMVDVDSYEVTLQFTPDEKEYKVATTELTVTITKADETSSYDDSSDWKTGNISETDKDEKPATGTTQPTDSSTETTKPTETTTPTEPAQPGGKQFSDVKPTDWFYDAVYDVANKGLMKGTSETTFSPQLGTTRAMLVTILYRLAGEPQAGQTAAFSDLESGSWYVDAVAWAAQNGIVKGYEDGTFKPNQDLTREQLVTMLYRYAQFSKQDVSAKADLSGYTDSDSISPYAVDAMQWAVAKGIIKGVGDNKLAPQGSATRAQIATMISRFSK